MDTDDDIQLHTLEAIEENLSVERPLQQSADGLMVFSASGLMVFSASGFMVF